MAKRRRKKGTGAVRLRKDGRWEGRLIVGRDIFGKPQIKYVMAKTKEECEEKVSGLQAQYQLTPARSAKNITFGEWIDFWYQNICKPKLRTTTQLSYENEIYKHIIPELGDILLKNLSQRDFQQFYTRLKSNGRIIRREQLGPGLSNCMVRACHANCRMAILAAIDEKLIYRNPIAGCKLPPKERQRIEFLELPELQRLMIQAKYEGYYELFLLELATGLRLGELLALQWEDLSFRTGELRIWRQAVCLNGKLQFTAPKTKASVRTVILPGVVVDILKKRKEELDSRWMFPSPVKEDQPLTHGCVRRRLKRTLERAECGIVRFHDLRHTFATMALDNGMDVKTLSVIIGHSSTATTLDVYSHVTNGMRQQAARIIDRKIGKVDIPNLPEKTACVSYTDFQPYQSKRRKSGTGCVYQINDHLWEGRYSPKGKDGRRISNSVYAKTKEECEEKLMAMIAKVKREIRLSKQHT